MSQIDILVTGATGYIGGSVLDRLLAHPKFKSFRITALIRAPEKAEALKSVGVTPIVGKTSDFELLENLASKADYAFTVTDCDDVPANVAILKGLKRRFEATGKKPVLIHTSGTGVLVDDAAGLRSSDVIWYDNKPEQIETLHPEAPHRPVDLDILRAAQEGYVTTHIILPGIVYGTANGRLVDIGIQRKTTIITPIYVKGALARGSVLYPGTGKNIWPYVHIDDCADLYLVLFNAILEGQNPANGREGFYFAETSEHTSFEYSKLLAVELKALGLLPTDEPTPATEEESAALIMRLIGGNARCRAERSRALGWKPRYGTADLAVFTKRDVEEIAKSL